MKGKLKFAGPVGWSFEGNKLTYRIVPIDYTAKGILDAPVMPARVP